MIGVLIAIFIWCVLGRLAQVYLDDNLPVETYERWPELARKLLVFSVGPYVWFLVTWDHVEESPL